MLQRRLNMGRYIDFNILNPEVLKEYMPGDFKTNLGYYGEAPDEIIEFAIQNAEKECNMKSNYLSINIGGERFYTNDLKGFADILKKYYKETDDYKYYEDTIIYEYPEVKENAEITTETINLDENSISVVN